MSGRVWMKSFVCCCCLYAVGVISEQLARPTDYPDNVPGQCNSANQFDCGGGKCIDFRLVRDCIADCQDGADEGMHCLSCGRNQIRCNDHKKGCGECVLADSAQTMCEDRKWSRLCTEPNMYQCKRTNNCVPKEWVNDGVNDCADDSDEDPCLNGKLTCGTVRPSSNPSISEIAARFPGNCSSGDSSNMDELMFDCGGGICIPEEKFRDCTVDCPDGIDEACFTGQRRCSESSCLCIGPSEVAEVCPKDTTADGGACDPQQFKCVTGGCIPLHKVLDGQPDCVDGTDETYCEKVMVTCPSEKPCSFDRVRRRFTCGCADSNTKSVDGHCRSDNNYPRDCADIQRSAQAYRSGIYEIYRPSCYDPSHCATKVKCDMQTNGGGWTYFQERTNDDVSFYRPWQDYIDGFGDIEQGNFWLGNKHVHDLTAGSNSSGYELLLKLEGASGDAYSIHYGHFAIGDHANAFRLSLGSPLAADAPDDLARSQGRAFGTRDLDRDSLTSITCGVYWQSGWWFDPDCDAKGNLNLPYKPPDNLPHLAGLHWGGVRLNHIAMLIRPKQFDSSRPPNNEATKLRASQTFDVFAAASRSFPALSISISIILAAYSVLI